MRLLFFNCFLTLLFVTINFQINSENEIVTHIIYYYCDIILENGNRK